MAHLVVNCEWPARWVDRNGTNLLKVISMCKPVLQGCQLRALESRCPGRRDVRRRRDPRKSSSPAAWHKSHTAPTSNQRAAKANPKRIYCSASWTRARFPRAAADRSIVECLVGLRSIHIWCLFSSVSLLGDPLALRVRNRLILAKYILGIV